MSINMPTTIKEERLRWVLPIANKEVKLKDVTKVLDRKRSSTKKSSAWRTFA